MVNGNKNKIVLKLILIMSLCFLNWGDKNNRDIPTTLVFPPYLHSYGIRKATKFHLFMFMQNLVKFRNPQALAVVRLDSWENPEAEGDDDEVTVYGVNSGQNNIIYNTSMTSLGVYGLNEQQPHQLNEPMGIAANNKGDVYVCDRGNNRIVRLFNNGKQLHFVRAIGTTGSGSEQFRQPHDVALDSKNNIYITDRQNHRVHVFDKHDSLKYIFGIQGKIDGQFYHPEAIAVNDHSQRWTYYRDAFLVIIDLDNTRIQKFDLSGNFIKSITVNEFGYTDPHLSYLALDYYSNIYVTDQTNHCVHKIDRNLNYLTTFGRKGTDDREFIEPRGIAIYRRFGQIFIAEKQGAQYYWVGTDYRNFTVRQHESQKHLYFFEYFLTEPSFITADIFDNKNRLVTRIWRRRFKPSGSQKDLWSCFTTSWPDSLLAKENMEIADKYKGLKTVPPGSYSVRFRFEPTYSSFNYFSKEVIKKFVIE